MKRYIRCAISKASDEDISIQMELVQDPNVDSDILDELADSNSDKDSWKVRYGVATHNNTLPKTLAKLSADPVDSIRSTVAANPNTPIDALRQLANDNTESVLVTLFNNPSCTPEIKELMWESGNDRVHRYIVRATTNPDFLDTLAESEDSDLRFEVCQNAYTSPETLHRLVHDPDKFVRRAIAGHHDTLPQDLETLANDSDWAVCCNVYDNCNCPVSALKTLVERGNTENSEVWKRLSEFAQNKLSQLGEL